MLFFFFINFAIYLNFVHFSCFPMTFSICSYFKNILIKSMNLSHNVAKFSKYYRCLGNFIEQSTIARGPNKVRPEVVHALPST